MSWPWSSPQGTRHALSERIRARYPPAQRPRRLREIAYRRLLVRLFAVQPDRWVLKGGAALLLRLDPNRTSNDIDLAYVGEAGEHAVALRALVEAAAHDAGDFFTFEVGRDQTVEVDPDHPLERAVTAPVVARVGPAVFAEFSVDLALPRADVVAVEMVTEPVPLTGSPAVDDIPQLAALALAAQVGDKVCALFERRGASGARSSRARDLADLAMIALQREIDGDELTRHVRREEERRLTAGTLWEPLPPALQLADEQLTDWPGRWAKATRDAPVSFDEAYAVAARFVDPVLAGIAGGALWSPLGQRWEPR